MKRHNYAGGLVRAALFLSFCAANQTATAEVAFTQITEGELATDAGYFFGCAWADYDNDGNVDLVIGHYGPEGNRLYHNEGDGTFTRITTGAIAEDTPSDPGTPVWADYDNDGDPDLFISCFEVADRFYRNEGNGIFTRITEGAWVNPNESRYGNSACWGDLNNDGFVDLFVANVGSRNYLYINNGDGTMSGGEDSTLGGSATSHLSTWSDYNMDGFIDLFVAQPAMRFKNKGPGTLELQSGPPDSRGSWQDIDLATADYDNDGDLDLVVVGHLGDRLYLNDGEGNFTEVMGGAIQAAGIGISSGLSWGDYDNDGKIDLFIGTAREAAVSAPDHLYHNEGNGNFTEVTGIALVERIGQSWTPAWADFDNDGDLDLIIPDGMGNFENLGDPAPCVLYRNDGGNDNNWFIASLEGVVSNRSALGAKVWVTATIGGQSVTQLREINGHNTELRAHFGLGDAATIEELRIQWPSGSEQVETDVPVNQIKHLTEVTWGMYPLPLDGWVDTGSWMGLLWVENAPWAWSARLHNWAWVPDMTAAAGEGWVYLPQ